MEALLQRQEIIAETIRKINVNFKKDSSSRKTADYIKKRLETLLELWSEFEANHNLLKSQDRSDKYFTSDTYNIVKQEYESLMIALRSLNPSTSEERGVPSKTDELISQQNTHFRAFSRLVGNINIDQMTEKWEIEDKLNMLQNRWKTIDETHWQIDNLLVGSNVDYELEYSKHESIFESTKRHLNTQLNSAVHQYRSVPKIEIPIFSGNYIQWPTFMDLYSEAIHKNTLLTKGQKMQHLKGKLRGEAERLVQHLTVSAENYDTCWEILTHRYNNIQQLFTKQIQVFMNQPTMHSQNAYELKRLHDISLEAIRAIHNLGVNTSTWDPILVHILTGKMDTETYSNYMQVRKSPRELPNFDELMDFLENKFTALEPVNTKKQNSRPQGNNIPTKDISTKPQPLPSGKPQQYFHKTYNTNFVRSCPICKTNHLLIHCKTFENMTSETKLKTLEQKNVCKNCLYSHEGKQCYSHKTCKTCNKPHHTILHDVIHETGCAQTIGQMKPADMTPSNATSSYHKANHAVGNNEVLLATVLLRIRASDGTYVLLRCLLDQGSQINLITEAAAQRLGLQRRKQNATVSGVGVSVNQSHGTVHLICESIYGDYAFSTEALVMTKILGNLPNYTFEKEHWPHLQNINLADPDYNISREVDVLLDAGTYAEIVLDGILRGPAQAPIAQQTKLGWVLLGNFKTFNCYAILNNLDEISQYWEMEEITNNKQEPLSPEEEYCENLYNNTTTRRSDGRYEVKIPMKPNFEQNLGSSKQQAVAQFKQLEKRLNKQQGLSESYKTFIDEYLNLGHMKMCTIPQEPSCFLPHHGVYKPESTTTKLRVVFNASAKTTTGYTLNQLMESGANLQQDLQTLLLGWRTYQYVYTADIEKFYRQIYIQEADQHLQKIVWRKSDAAPIKEYQLCTVTYGTKAAPFLAMRTIKQLVKDDGENYPLAADLLNNRLYMDDLLGGSNSVTEAQQAQQQLIDLLAGGGFKLRKWTSNSPEILKTLTEDLISLNMLDFKHAESNKTLGITWNPRNDQFTFHPTKTDDSRAVVTKRLLLSELSKLYDPLGWLSPVTTKGKLIFQQAWMSCTNWDDGLPENIQKDWERFEQDKQNIRNITIPRWMGDTTQSVELHGFSDASEKAYGCVIYCRSSNQNGQPTIQLVAGKTKLAPLKKPTSLPRLELCGALLLSRLMKKVIESTKVQIVKVFGWTDSMVVLGWLQGDQSRWKTFVANRIAQIKENMGTTCWKYVKSEENPADCASRGLFASQLLTHTLWWKGPLWLKNNMLPEQPKTPETKEELKTEKVVCFTQKTYVLVEELLNKHSSMSRVTRVLAWILRFINNTRNKTDVKQLSHLTTRDIENAHNIIVKSTQHSDFAQEIALLQKHKQVHSTSKILNLNPILDNDGILKVGGRLQHAALSSSQKHPIILSNKNRLCELLIRQAHETTLHGGPRLTLAHLRNRYWILGGMNTVKKQLIKCVRCHRFKTSRSNQLMADLPKPRVTPSRPFTHTGVDFTGQVEVKANKGRGIKITKGYIAIFICLATKAIHLELVSDLSTPAFLAALKRLCARRGTPKHLYSDNGTNFIGAAKILTKERKEALQYYINNEFLDNIAESGIEWHFNAPCWPTAGGLWEAAVRSMKHHLKRVLGEQKLTYEEFTTLLVQIEACLNSRPLVTLTSAIEDLECLTPGHFLVGGPVLSPPLAVDLDNRSLTTRWKLTEKMHRDFWKQWSSDYLQTIQGRGKWKYATNNLEIGDIVLVKEDNIPPARWFLGKVTDTHPGTDGRVRVVTLKTKNNKNLKRPVTKLSRLPIESETPRADSNNVNKEGTNKPTRNRSSKRTLQSYLCIMLMFLAMCISPSTQQIQNITSLDSAKLIYFDKIADLQIIQDEWKMVVYYNMSTYWQSLANIEKYVNYLTSLCKTEVSLLTIASQFQHDLNELNHYNDVLRSEHGRRMKRGIIDGVGYVANYLFGVLDERFAEQYDKDIKTIQENENHLLTLYKQHTSIIEGEYNLLKRNEEVMNKQFLLINKHLEETEARTKQSHENIMYITTTAIAANMVISNLRRVQQLLLDLVTDIRSGRVDTHLLKPDEFERQLNIISGQIPKGLSLPCVNSFVCIREMYKLSRVHVRMTESFLIFEVKIPLINDEQYELSRVIPIRKISGKSMINIIPTSEYIATNLKKDTLMYLQSEDLSSCITLNEHQLLCATNKPIHYIKATASTCEGQIINNRNNISSCRTARSHCSEEWIGLHSRGAWLYTCCDKCTVRTFCATEITTYSLQGTGIISLSDGCMLKGEQLTILSHSKLQSDLLLNEEETYIPESGVNSIINSSDLLHLQIESHDEQFKMLHNKIEHVKDQQATFRLQANHTVAHNYVMYGFITACGLAVCIWSIIRIRRRCRRQQQTIQLERRNPTRRDEDGSSVCNEIRAELCKPVQAARYSKVDKATSPIDHCLDVTV